MPPEERDDRLQQILTPAHDVSVEVLAMVVVSLVREDLRDTEELTESLQHVNALRALRNSELVSDLVPGSVASSPRAVWLPHETDREASFSVYKTYHPATEL